MSHTWKLTVKFGYDYDDVTPSPTGEEEAAQFIAYVLREWCMEPCDLEADEMIKDGAKVILHADNLAYLEPAIRWITNTTVPKKLTIKRID